MKNRIVYTLLLLLFLTLAFFLRTLMHEVGTIEANTIKIEHGLIVDEAGSPMSGTLLGKPDHIEEVLQPFLDLVSSIDDWQKLSVGRKLNLNHLGEMQEDLRGFSVQAEVKDGKLTDETSVWYNLRTAREEVFGYPLQKSLKYYLGSCLKMICIRMDFPQQNERKGQKMRTQPISSGGFITYVK